MSPVDVLLDVVAEIAQPATDTGAAARAACAQDGPMSDAMAAWAVATTCARYDRAAVATLVARRDLAGRSVAISLARSVGTAPLRAIALALLRGAQRVRVRVPAEAQQFCRVVVERIRGRGVDVKFATGPSNEWLREQIAEGAHHVVAFGSDETVSTIRADVPAHVGFEGHGHGFGISIATLGPPAVSAPWSDVGDAWGTWGTWDAWDAWALDIAAYDQFGCLSPQVGYLVSEAFSTPDGDAVLAQCVRALGAALERVEVRLPRVALDLSTAASVHQWQGARAASSEHFARGGSWSVAASRGPVAAGSPGARNISLGTATSVSELATRLRPMLPFVTTVGVVGDLTTVREALCSRSPGAVQVGFHGRVVPAGTMQDPPLDGPEDPRPPRRS